MSAPVLHVQLPDTGPRRLAPTESQISAGTVVVQRIGPMVSLQGTGLALTGASTNFFLLEQPLPLGWQPVISLDGTESVPLLRLTQSIGLVEHTYGGRFRTRNIGQVDGARFSMMFLTRDPWPTTLPGDPL